MDLHRKGYSTSDYLFALQAIIEILRKKKQKVFCAFTDFSQAFDKVWRAGLWHKLLQYNINGKLFKVINNMYNNIKSSIGHNGTISPEFVSEIGVRQGENLSPALFSIYLNDLQSYLQNNGSVWVELSDTIDFTLWLKLLVLLYADDTVLIANSELDLQKSLDIFNNYCENWHLQVNTNKTKMFVFGARKLGKFKFKLGNSDIEIRNNG